MFRRQLLLATLLAAPLAAQTPTVVAYGAPCPAGSLPLATQGLPRIGTTFTVVDFERSCSDSTPTVCSLPFLLVGFARDNTVFSLPVLSFGSGCTVLVNPVTVLSPATNTYQLAIPNNVAFVGVQLDYQRVSLWLTYVPLQLLGVDFSQGIEAVIGL